MSQTASSREPTDRARCSVCNALKKAPFQILGSPAVWIPAAVLAVVTAVFYFSNADTYVSQLFFQSNGPAERRLLQWPLAEVQPWITLYNWGCYPALLLGCGGLAAWILSFFWKRVESWRNPGLFYALLLIVGPGLLVNVLAKPYWNRPRPYATRLFGGRYDFLPVLERGQQPDNYSFPSGHASMGFYLMAPAFVVYRKRPRVALAFLLLGLGGGMLMGFTRIVAGGHYATDILWAGGFVYFAALVLAAPFRFGQCEKETPAA